MKEVIKHIQAGKGSISTPTISDVPNTTLTNGQYYIRHQLNYN